MQTTQNDLYTMTLCKEDWFRVQNALRAQAGNYYSKMVELGEQGPYYELLWQERGYCNALADDIDSKMS